MYPNNNISCTFVGAAASAWKGIFLWIVENNLFGQTWHELWASAALPVIKPIGPLYNSLRAVRHPHIISTSQQSTVSAVMLVLKYIEQFRLEARNVQSVKGVCSCGNSFKWLSINLINNNDMRSARRFKFIRSTPFRISRYHLTASECVASFCRQNIPVLLPRLLFFFFSFCERQRNNTKA